MEITPKFQFVEGSFDTLTNKMLVIANENHGRVDLCFKEEGCGWNIPFAKIELYDSNLFVDYKATLEDAKKLGAEISRRWNECTDKK